MATAARPAGAARAARVHAGRPWRQRFWRPPLTSRSPRWYRPGLSSAAIIAPPVALGWIPWGKKYAGSEDVDPGGEVLGTECAYACFQSAYSWSVRSSGG